MFIKLDYFREQFRKAVVLAPVEMIISFLYYLAAVVTYYQGNKLEDCFLSFPIVFCIIYVVNGWTAGTKYRWWYYLSALSCVGFWQWNLDPEHSLYWVTLLLSQLFVTLRVRQGDNDSFVQNGLCYIRDMAAALFLVAIGWGLAIGIYWSVVYIFDLNFSEYRFLNYSAQVAWFLVAPVIFLMFNLREKKDYTTNRFFGTLVNFIVSPALLVYNLILYLYFVKITVIWSLPKGGVAYMVLIFVVLMLMFKSMQPILNRRYFDWYYRYFSILILPPVVMLWVSMLYRIGEYGWTEWRVYLVLTACVATVAMLLFFIPRWSRYRWVALLSFCLLALFSYIPGIEAETLGLRSQEKRIDRAMDKLYDRATGQWVQTADSVVVEQYRILYNSSKYVERNKDEGYLQKRFGFSFAALDTILSLEIQEKLEEFYAPGDWLYLYYENSQIVDISGYDSLVYFHQYNEGKGIYYEYDQEYLQMKQGDTVLASVHMDTFFRQKLSDAGFDPEVSLTTEELTKVEYLFQQCVTGNKLVVFSSIQIDPLRMHIKEVTPIFLLTGKK